MTFDEAFEKLVGIEGALSLDPRDRGNYTPAGVLKGSKYGVSARSYPDEDIAGLTLSRAKELYLRDFWKPLRCDEMPEGVRYLLFDTAVNTSAPGKPVTAIKLLQRAVGVKDDGVIGPITLAAVHAMEPLRVVLRFTGLRHLRNADAVTWADHGKGWTRRVAQLQLEA